MRPLCYGAASNLNRADERQWLARNRADQRHQHVKPRAKSLTPRRGAADRGEHRQAAGFTCSVAEQRTILSANALAPLCRSHAFRKYNSTCLAVVSAQLWKLTTSGNASGDAHCFAARKTDTVRLDVFSVHQP